MSSENTPKTNVSADAVNTDAEIGGAEKTALKKQAALDKNQEKYLKYRHSGEISKEFGRQIARGEDPRCTYPWNRLDIVLRDNRTKVCSDFPTRLPRFDWPSTEDFHNEDQMWNHPFMQRMRGGMGTDDAVPFCDICVRANKRAMKNMDWRKKAQHETRQLYHAVEAEVLRNAYKGNVNDFEDTLSELSFEKPNGRSPRLFKDPLDFYRRRVNKHRFFKVGRVLQLGLRTALASPFLAEANSSFTVADFSEPDGAFVAQVVRHFELEVEAQVLDPQSPLPFADNSFDGVWLDGQTLFHADRDVLLEELKRILDADGVIHVQEAYGPAVLLRLILQDPDGNNGRADVADILAQHGHAEIGGATSLDGAIGAPYQKLFSGSMDDDLTTLRASLDASIARETLLDGTKQQGVGNFFTEKELRRVLRKYQLTIDTVKPAQFRPERGITIDDDATARLVGDNALMSALGAVAIDPQGSLTDLANYDGYMIFNVFANVSNRKGTTT